MVAFHGELLRGQHGVGYERCDHTDVRHQEKIVQINCPAKTLPAIVRMLLFAAALASSERPISAQETPPVPAAKLEAPAPATHHARAEGHRFWDKTNGWLFASVAASRTLDYSSTLNMRRRGRQEILLTNDVVDNHAAFAAIEAAGTGISMGAAYLFHRYGHHKLERWTSIVHIGLATTGSVRNYCLKTRH